MPSEDAPHFCWILRSSRLVVLVAAVCAALAPLACAALHMARQPTRLQLSFVSGQVRAQDGLDQPPVPRQLGGKGAQAARAAMRPRRGMATDQTRPRPVDLMAACRLMMRCIFWGFRSSILVGRPQHFVGKFESGWCLPLRTAVGPACMAHGLVDDTAQAVVCFQPSADSERPRPADTTLERRCDRRARHR